MIVIEIASNYFAGLSNLIRLGACGFGLPTASAIIDVS